MAFDSHLAERIEQILIQKKVVFYQKKMMGGLCFMVNEKMCCAIHFDKKKQLDLLMARIGPEQEEIHKNRPGCLPMDFTGRPMKGFVFVDANGFDLEEDLLFWINLCLAYNPKANSSKKRK